MTITLNHSHGNNDSIRSRVGGRKGICQATLDWTGSVTLAQFYNLSLPFKSLYVREGVHLLTWENLSHQAMANNSYPSGTRSSTVQNCSTSSSDWAGKFHFHSHAGMANNSGKPANTGFQREVMLVPPDWEMVLFWRKKRKIFHQENTPTDTFRITCPQRKWAPKKGQRHLSIRFSKIRSWPELYPFENTTGFSLLLLWSP